MAYYLRKGINFGPLRVNLSKGGLGFSFGVTGARVGLDAKGRSYVHAGRGGLYYRKQLGGGKKGSKENKTARAEPIDIFVDTGLVTTHNTPSLWSLPSEAQEMPKALGIPLKFIFLGGGSGVLLFLFSSLVGVKLLGFLLVLVCFFLWFFIKKTEKRWEQAAQKFRSYFAAAIKSATIKELLPTKADEIVTPYIFYDWCRYQVEENNPVPTTSFFRLFWEKKEVFLTTQLFLLEEIIDEALRDHELTIEEEELVNAFFVQWSIPNKEQLELKEKYTFYKGLREKFAEICDKKKSDILFKAPGKLLKENVLSRFQRDNIPYREVGYVLDLEGSLVVNNKDISLVYGEGLERSYSVSAITDVTFSPNRGVVEIALAGRKSSLILATEKLVELSVVLERLSQDE